MAITTISLELDAYEKLRRAKRGGESFSAVVRRARFDETAEEAPSRIEESPGGYGVSVGSPEYRTRFTEKERVAVALESFDSASKRQAKRNSAWKKHGGESAAKTGRGWTREELYSSRMPRP